MYSPMAGCAVTVQCTASSASGSDRSGRRRREGGEHRSAPVQFHDRNASAPICLCEPVGCKECKTAAGCAVVQWASSVQKKGVWVQEEDEGEAGKEVQLDQRFRPSSWGHFRQKTTVTQPITDRCCCSGYTTRQEAAGQESHNTNQTNHRFWTHLSSEGTGLLSVGGSAGAPSPLGSSGGSTTGSDSSASNRDRM